LAHRLLLMRLESGAHAARGGTSLRAEFRDGTNTSLTYYAFVERAIQYGFIGFGDILVRDNARIHSSAAIQIVFDAMLARHGIDVIDMPVYSPELNPCELVFGESK
jgi:hypothetical protein